MDIEEIKKELAPREGLREEALERVLAKGRGNARFPFRAALICGFAAIAAVVLGAVLITKGEKPSAEAENTQRPEPTLSSTESSADSTAQSTARRTPKPEMGTDVSLAEFAEGTDLFSLIDSASVIIKGIVESTAESETLDFVSYAEFTVTECIRGDIGPGDTVPVRANLGEKLRNGNEYLLMVNPMASVFEGRELFYQIDSYFSSVQDTEFSVLEGAKGAGFEEIVEKVRAYAADNEYSGSDVGRGFYCTSEDIKDIVDYSEIVVRVRVNETFYDGTPDRTSYTCEALECLKGNTAKTIDVVALKHAMEPGGEYLVLLTRSWEELYTVSSRNSVFPAESPEAVQIAAMLG
ncbi:MAG: hypothetical protein II536_04815 [Clostridia bacterium]|nr:hypothetical protein [Clostridia bacterium]